MELTHKQIADLIGTFKDNWASNAMRGAFHDAATTSIKDEFYHGACHYFATALYSVLGPENCAVYSLEGRRADGTTSFIHAILDYLPHRLATGASALPHQLAINEEADEAGCTYDIQSPDGRAWEQANYRFVSDPYDTDCPLIEGKKWHADLVQWTQDEPEQILAMISEYRKAPQRDKEHEYWLAIEDCLKKSMKQVLQAHQTVVLETTSTRDGLKTRKAWLASS